jgi:hypothetical protein
VIDVGMGQKQITDVPGRHRKIFKGELRVVAIGFAAVDENVDTHPGLDEMAGAGDAVLGA